MPEYNKIEVGYSRIQRLTGLDELAQMVFPGNRNHQKAFLTIFIELKYAEHRFLPSLNFICTKYNISRRTLEKVRAKMKRLGIISRVSQFSPKYRYKAGWEFSSRFARSLETLAAFARNSKQLSNSPTAEKNERALLDYF